MHTSIHSGRTENHPASPHAMVLTVSFVLSPVIGLFCHRRPRKLVFANLTPASRRQDHTTSPSASKTLSSEALLASIASSPASVTIAIRPSSGVDGGHIKVICGFGKPEYFFGRDWTGRNSLIRLEKLDFTRKSAGGRGGRQQPDQSRGGVCDTMFGLRSSERFIECTVIPIGYCLPVSFAREDECAIRNRSKAGRTSWRLSQS